MSAEDRRMNSRIRAFLFSQIEETKDNVRLAYVLGARQKAGDTLSQQELDFLQEQEIEKRVLEKLEKMLDRSEHPVGGRRANPSHGLLGEKEVFAVLRFFYLVRIAQQGFLPLIANAYPTLEPEAIIYLADKLVAGSVGGISTIHHELSFAEMMKNEARGNARDIAFKLYKEANEPVADGFTTTYKEIMQIAHCIAGQGIYEHQQKASDASATTLFEPSIASVPPVYVVLPHMSMVGDLKLSVPPVDPTLPIPGFLLSSKTAHVTPAAPKDVKEDLASSAWTDPNAIVDDFSTVPAKTTDVETPPPAAHASEDVPDQLPVEANGHDDHPNTTHEKADPVVEADETAAKDTEKTTRKKKSSSSKKKSKRSKSDKSKRSESRASQDAATTSAHDEQFQDQEPDNDNNEPEPQQQQQGKEEEDSDNDRFADADLSDDEHEILKQDDGDDNQVQDTTSTTQAQQSSDNAATPSDTTTTNTAAVPSPSQWQNFAATCQDDTDGLNTPSTPKGSARSSPKSARR